MTTTEEVIYNLDKNSPMTNKEIAQQEVNDFRRSLKRKWMVTGDKYYRVKNEVLDRKRYIIGEGGAKIEATNLANNKLAFGFIRKLVDQKTGYLLSKPLSVTTDGPDEYKAELDNYFGKAFLRQLKNLGKNAVNCGIAWLQVYYSEQGELKFKVIPSWECVPLWKDADHTELDGMIRFYKIEAYEARTKKEFDVIEFWDSKGVTKWVENNPFGPSEEWWGHYELLVNENAEDVVKQMAWQRIPFIPFKYNDEEMPLVEVLKTLVDDYDNHVSDNSNNLEDLPNSIFVVKNYDGTNAGEMRRNLSQLRVVKISDPGDVKTLSLDIDTEAFSKQIEILRKDIYEFGRGVDTQSSAFGNSPSGIALRFLYSDLDMDANIIETEFQASLEQLLWFVDQHLANKTGKDYSDENVEFVFNRDILINESEAIQNARDSIGIESMETIVANHPWTTDVAAELLRKKEEDESQLINNDPYATLNSGTDGDDI